MSLPSNGELDHFQTVEAKLHKKTSSLRYSSRSKGINLKTVSPLLATNNSGILTQSGNPLCGKENMSLLLYLTTGSSCQACQGCQTSESSDQASGKNDQNSVQNDLSSSKIDQTSRKNDSHASGESLTQQGLSPSSHLMDSAKISSKQASKFSLNEQLRILALKEMSLVELKDTIANLNVQLRQSERELQAFRQTVQRSLYREMQIASEDLLGHKKEKVLSSQHTSSKSNTHKSANPNTNKSANPKTHKSANSNTHTNPNPNTHTSATSSKEKSASSRPKATHLTRVPLKKPAVNQKSPRERTRDPPSSLKHTKTPEQLTIDEPTSLWASISKPITFVQNLEDIIQHEMGVSRTELHHSTQKALLGQKHELIEKETSTLASLYANSGSLESLKDTIAETIPFRDPELMLQTVSNSLWAFVNEVKQNVLAPTMSPEQLTRYDQESGSEFTQSDKDEPVDLSIYSKMRHCQENKP